MAETPNDNSSADKHDPARASALVEPRNFAKFLLYGKKDILAVLNKLREDVSLITMFFDSGRELLLTSLIAADDENLALDFGPDSGTNRKALAADKLFCVASQGKVRMHLTLTPQKLPDTTGYNVIADLEGSENPEQVVIVSGHLDSWDLGTGAIDDGAGVAVAMEAA